MLWIISVLDRSDSTLQTWAVAFEDLVVPSIKEECDEFDDLHLPDTLDGITVALDAWGYHVFVTQQEDPW